jgi:hypothetical protein
MRITGLNSSSGLYNTYTTTNTDVTSRNSSFTAGYIGSASANTFNGFIFEIIVYRDALTSSQVQMVENYLYKKWGIF